jgi:extradiol dioxygenase family protein
VVNDMMPFHLAFAVNDLEAARAFYVGVLGCREGRSDATWVDFDLYGHQIVAHLGPGSPTPGCSNDVDGHDIPVPHFGVILSMEQWRELAEHLSAAGVDFILKPTVRFRGRIGEQGTFFVRDPSGNALEFKAFARFDQVFAK